MKNDHRNQAYDLATEIVDQGEDHPAIRELTVHMAKVYATLKEVKREAASYKKVGGDFRVDLELIPRVVQSVQELANVSNLIAAQMENALSTVHPGMKVRVGLRGGRMGPSSRVLRTTQGRGFGRRLK